MKVTVPFLNQLNSEFVRFAWGSPTAEAYRPWPPEIAPPGALVYVSTLEQLQTALEVPAGIIVALPQLVKSAPQFTNPNQAVFTTPAITAAMALINPFFEEKKARWPQGISAKADVHPSAMIGKDVSIGAFSVVGENAQIGDGCTLSPHSIVERGAILGTETYLHPFVYIGSGCQIGARCEIHSHTSIGSDGFGYVTDAQLNHHKVPQLGRVIIEDDVEIGSNCAIDRATLDVTKIGRGSKLDNFVHIAHNCKIGKNAMITARFVVAGSSQIGENFRCGGDVGVVDHITITDNVTLGGRSVVTKDVTEPGAYTGYPLLPWREGLRMIASQANVPELRKEVIELKKKVAALKID
jgi:UDP-3-O-[3-hydroxymyristoyl] glucosamine N-acyltransferase